MQRIKLFVRYACGLALIVLGGFWLFGSPADRPSAPWVAHAAELNVPDDAAVERFDFEPGDLEGWTTINGQWAVEEMPGAPSGQRVLVQRAVKNAFNVMVVPGGPYTDVDVSVRFKPINVVPVHCRPFHHPGRQPRSNMDIERRSLAHPLN